MSSPASSVRSSSEEDVNGGHQDDSKATEGAQGEEEDQKEAVVPPKKAEENPDITRMEEKKSGDEGEVKDEEFIIEYTVETKQNENKLPEITGDGISPEEKRDEDKEVTPTPDSVRMQGPTSEPNDVPKEESKSAVAMAAAAPPASPPSASGEVVEEIPLSVKEQVAIFANLNIQETHGTPKPGVASAFTKTYSSPNDTQNKPTQCSNIPEIKKAPQVASPSNAMVYKEVATQPSGTVDAGFVKQTDQRSVQPSMNKSDRAIFERPQPLDRPSEPSPQPKKFVFKGITSTPPMTFGLPFGKGSQSVKPAESPVKEVPPAQYLGPGVIAQTTRPPMVIRLRRPGPEAPWGFAVFGGADYGCPPFISRVTLHSIAARAGLEVGDIVVNVCDAPVQEKEHSQIKAEILRAGNELDFTVIKQGIDKEVLAQRAPNLLRTSAPATPSGAAVQHPRASGTWSSATSSPHADKATLTRSFRLLDKHLNAMGAPPSPLPQMTPPKAAEDIPTTQRYYSESALRSNYTMDRNYTSHTSSNRAILNHTIHSPNYLPSMGQNPRAEPHPVGVAEINTNRTYFATPATISRGNSDWCNSSPTRVYYGSPTSLSRPGTWSSSANQEMRCYESQSSVERCSADDPGLMTQYYGTQQTCYARYRPQSQHRHEQTVIKQNNYKSSGEWSSVSPQQSVPTSRVTYRPSGNSFFATQEPKQHLRQHQSQQQMQNFFSVSDYQDQERWSTAGSVQTYNTGWM